LFEFHKRLLPLAASHESSLAQDLRNGRRTEIAWINGQVQEMAEAHGVPAPYNTVLCQIVKALEASRNRPNPNRSTSAAA
jgi:2-dehydropantoate 2-reductase